jgi:hypothetical protein
MEPLIKLGARHLDKDRRQYKNSRTARRDNNAAPDLISGSIKIRIKTR